jgi:peroxiredoxin
MTSRSIVPTLLTVGLSLTLAVSATAQATKKPTRAPDRTAKGAVPAAHAETRDQINARFAVQRLELEKKHIVELANLAAHEKGAEADETYRELFNLAIAHDLYRDAQPAAQAVIKAGHHAPQVDVLAHFVNIVALADKGQYDDSINHLREFMEAREKAAEGDQKRLDTATALAIGEAYFQRLTRAGRYDTAQKLAKLAIEHAKDPAVKEHFSARLARLSMVGKPAPEISGTDADGKAIKLSDYKGKVVLVDFWATWCVPCSGEMHRFNIVANRYASKGLVVLGVNEDPLATGSAAKPEEIRSAIRRFLIDHRVSWPSVIDEPGDKSISTAYGVNDIPANFLIGPDGKIVAFELAGPDLDRAITQALGGKH